MIVPRDRLEVRLSVITGHLQARIDEICDALDGTMAKLVLGIPRVKDEVRRVGVMRKKEATTSKVSPLHATSIHWHGHLTLESD